MLRRGEIVKQSAVGWQSHRYCSMRLIIRGAGAFRQFRPVDKHTKRYPPESE